MINYDDPHMEAIHRQRAQTLAYWKKDTGLRLLGTEDRRLHFEALIFKEAMEPSEPRLTTRQAANLIEEEFEKLYGMTPKAYCGQINPIPIIDNRPREEIEAEVKELETILEQILGRDD